MHGFKQNVDTVASCRYSIFLVRIALPLPKAICSFVVRENAKSKHRMIRTHLITFELFIDGLGGPVTVEAFIDDEQTDPERAVSWVAPEQVDDGKKFPVHFDKEAGRPVRFKVRYVLLAKRIHRLSIQRSERSLPT